MILSFLLALVAAATTLVLLLPLLRRRQAGPTRLAHELAIYRDQLAELDRDVANGRLAKADAQAARIEIERRIIAAGARAEAMPAPPTSRPRYLSWVIALGVPCLALLIYLETGRPDLPSQPFAGRGPASSDPGLAEAERTIAELRRRLADKPDSLDLYRALAQLLMSVDRVADALAVLREARKRGADDGDTLALLGEALTLEAEGVVIPEAQALFRQSVIVDAGNPRARFYLGRADVQAGNARGALERWLALEADAGPGAAWLPAVSAEIDRVAKAAGIDPLSINPQRKRLPAGGMRGTTADDVARMQQLSPEARQAAIRNMVEGLEARLKESPEDLDGWMRLGNAWKTLEEFDRAKAALLQADRLKPDDPTILAELVEAMVRAAPPGQPPDAETVAVLRRLEKLRPDNALMLFYLGEAAFAAGDKDDAIRRFRRLLAQVPAEAPIRAVIENRLRTIEESK